MTKSILNYICVGLDILMLPLLWIFARIEDEIDRREKNKHRKKFIPIRCQCTYCQKCMNTAMIFDECEECYHGDHQWLFWCGVSDEEYLEEFYSRWPEEKKIMKVREQENSN